MLRILLEYYKEKVLCDDFESPGTQGMELLGKGQVFNIC